MLIEKLKSSLVGSILQRPADGLRGVVHGLQRWREPGLTDYFAEGPRTTELMRAVIHDGVNCIDVGAHLGWMTHEILRLSPSGQHIAIEPVGYKAEWLRRKFPGVRVIAGAAGETNGSITFEIIEGSGSADSGLKARDIGRPVRRVEVPCHRLDDLVDPRHRIGFIKMDVIGAELTVMRGARGLIRRDRPVLLFECTSTSTAAMGVDPRELFRFVADELGYEVFSLKGWALKHEPLDEDRFLSAQVFPFEAFNFVGMPRKAAASRHSQGDPVAMRNAA